MAVVISTVFFKNDCFRSIQIIKPGTWCECPTFLLQITSTIRSDLPPPTYHPKPPSSCWQIQHIYLNEPLKHVSQRQEGNEAIILIWENNFLQDREVWWISKKGGRVMKQQYGGGPRCSHLSLWEILRSRQPHFHVWAWLPLGFLCEDTQTKLHSDQQPNVATEPEKNMMGH